MFELTPKPSFNIFVFFKKPRFNINNNRFVSGQILYVTCSNTVKSIKDFFSQWSKK